MVVLSLYIHMEKIEILGILNFSILFILISQLIPIFPDLFSNP